MTSMFCVPSMNGCPLVGRERFLGPRGGAENIAKGGEHMDVVEASGTRKSGSFPVFVYADGGTAKVVEGHEQETLEELLGRAGVPVSDTTRAYVPAEADDEFVGEDEDDGLDRAALAKTLGALGVGRGGRVVCSCCHRVAVEIRYQNQTLRHKFSPRARVRRVIRWAAHRLHLENDGLKLKVCGTTDYLSESKHLGELVQAPSCALCVELVMEPRVNG